MEDQRCIRHVIKAHTHTIQFVWQVMGDPEVGEEQREMAYGSELAV